jgi:hypothetical protein
MDPKDQRFSLREAVDTIRRIEEEQGSRREPTPAEM